ncbi:hypothetical protein [Paenibacillus polymyxa]|uniref:hypothetical protein n=1 Tax=Paenibacillus polymyxa TaxID=1406 RepID=UPI00126A356A|nr:hypothetical protein [Paenibacillus polymyxa]MBY7740181.1 hypothetical protein [Paenibacillus polymyxa]
MAVSNLVLEEAIQVDLFSGPTIQKLQHLGAAIDSIQARFRGSSIFRVSSITRSPRSMFGKGQRIYKYGC